MKNGLTFLVFFISIQATFGQISIGVKSGMNFSKQRYYFDHKYSSTFGSINGFELGAMALLPLKKGFELKPELGVVQKGGQVPDDFWVKINVLELLTSINYRITSNNISLYTGTGFFVGYGLSGYIYNFSIKDKRKIDFDSKSFDVNRHEGGLIGLFGCSFILHNGNSICLEATYRRTFTFFQNQQLEDFHISNKNTGSGIRLGYFFNLNK